MLLTLEAIPARLRYFWYFRYVLLLTFKKLRSSWYYHIGTFMKKWRWIVLKFWSFVKNFQFLKFSRIKDILCKGLNLLLFLKSICRHSLNPLNYSPPQPPPNPPFLKNGWRRRHKNERGGSKQSNELCTSF